ncbi:hypothetical protein Tco_1509155 [Tanacetum coccineum]
MPSPPISNQFDPAPCFPPVQETIIKSNPGNISESLPQIRGKFNQAPAYQPPVSSRVKSIASGCSTSLLISSQSLSKLKPSNSQEYPKEDFPSLRKCYGAVPYRLYFRDSHLVTLFTNPKEDLKGINRLEADEDYQGNLTIHTTSSPKVVEREPEVTKDTMPPTNNGSTEDVQPPVVPVVHHESISKPVNAPVSASRPNQKASIPFPSRRNDERLVRKLTTKLRNSTKSLKILSFEIMLYGMP